jgi:hypothetical protein
LAIGFPLRSFWWRNMAGALFMLAMLNGLIVLPAIVFLRDGPQKP